MHVGGKGIENLLMSMMLKKMLLKKHKAKKIFFYASLLENKLNIFQFGIVEMITFIITTYELKVVLPKLGYLIG
jgi:predicted transcriptional regulator